MEAFAISVSATLEDGVTPGLLRIIDRLTAANAAMLDFAANVRNLSRLGLNIGASLKKAAEGATALGDSSAGLTRASYVLDSMAVSSADLARNMAAANKAAGRGAIIGGGYRGGSGGDGGETGPAYGAGEHERNSPIWNHVGKATKGAALVTGGVVVGGVYENAKLQDAVALSMQAQGIPMQQQGAMSKVLMARAEDAYSQYGFTGKGLGDFAHGFLGADFLLHGFAPKDRDLIESTVLPYAANEAAIKGVPMDETMKSFIELAHMAGAYTASDIKKVLPAFINTSLSTDVSIQQLTRQASYAMKPLMQIGVSAPTVLAMVAAMNRAGVTNTKSGTWLADAFLNLQPKTLGSALFKSSPQTQALHQLGLLDAQNHLTYLAKDGKVDAMRALQIVHAHIEKMSPTEAEGIVLRAVGKQGGRGILTLADSSVLPQLSSILAAQASVEDPNGIKNEILANSPGAKVRLTAANAELTAMNATSGATNSVNKLLGSALSLAKTARTFSEKHPYEALGGIAGGVFAGMTAWKLVGMGTEATAGAIGKKLIPAIAKGIGGLIMRALDGLSVGLLDASMGATIAGAGAATIALGTTIAAAFGYGVGKLFIGAINWAVSHISGKSFDLSAAIGGGIYDLLHPDVSKLHPDVSKLHPDVSKLHPDVSKLYPDVSKLYPDVSKLYPDVSKLHPDVSKNITAPTPLPPRSQQAIVHHTQIHMDGKKVAEVVTQHQASAAAKPPSGPNQIMWGLGLNNPSLTSALR
jgi:hypothetical protein